MKLLNEVIAAALAQPQHSAVKLTPYENHEAFSAVTAIRVCAGFAQTNHEALTYDGEAADVLKAKLAGLDSQIDFHKNEISRMRAELLRAVGGADAAAQAAAAGIELEYDSALVTGQSTHEKARYKVSQERAKVALQFVTAQASEGAKSELAAILAALIGGLQ